jgi:hypothetical protein
MVLLPESEFAHLGKGVRWRSSASGSIAPASTLSRRRGMAFACFG